MVPFQVTRPNHLHLLISNNCRLFFIFKEIKINFKRTL